MNYGDTSGEHRQVAPFKASNSDRWITRSDMAHWVQTQKYHDEHSNDPGHWCDLCPVQIVFGDDGDNQR